MNELDPDIEQRIRNANPWWKGDSMLLPSSFKRWTFDLTLKRLKKGTIPIVALRGPRQVGKTTIMRQIIQQLLDEGVSPNYILRVQFEDLPIFEAKQEPILGIAYWFEEQILGKSFNTIAHEGQKVYLFFDELQNILYWAPQLKYLVDMNSVRVLITGSSALQIARGQDSLAGRIRTIEMGPLFLREIAALRDFGNIPAFLPINGIAELKRQDFWQELRAFGQQHQEIRDKAFATFSERGAYPIAHLDADVPWEETANQLNETIISRVITHDLRMGEEEQHRDEQLLEEVFRLVCRYSGQTPQKTLLLDEIKRSLDVSIDWQKALNYLNFLASSLLIRLIEPLELRLKRRRSTAKLCLCDHALRASWLQEVIPITEIELTKNPHLSVLAGHIVESIVGYFISSLMNLGVAHFPERSKGQEPEIDFILTVGDQRIPVEVKYRKKIDADDLRGLQSFIERSYYRAPFGLLITQNESTKIDDPRIVQMPLSTFLLMR
jgi:predicted AAA+ superfamily ATPase